MTGKTRIRNERVTATREAILTAAERLFAEHGVFAVSNRRISEAAGQGNNAAVGYHFGTKLDLVRAIFRKHNDEIEHRRAELLTEIGDSGEVRDWVACLVRPMAEYLAASGNPTWYARFSAQVMTDPVLREAIAEEVRSSPGLVRVIEGLDRCLPDLPADVRAERGDMVRQLMLHVIAERERAPRSSRRDAVEGLIDAIVRLWQAPVTDRP